MRILFAGVILTFMLVRAGALEEEKNERKPMPKFIRNLFRKLFDKDFKLKEKREVAEEKAADSSEETKSTKKQVVNAIHVGPHLGPPQGTLGTGYFGNAGFPVPVPSILPTAGYRSHIANSKESERDKGKNQKRWWPYGLGFGPFVHNHIGHGYGFGTTPYGYGFPGNTLPGYGPIYVRCKVPKGKGESAKRCFAYGGFGLGPGGLGPYGLGYGFPGFGYFPGFVDRPVYASLPWQKSAKKSSTKRWFGHGFGFGGPGMSLGLGFGGHNQLIGYPGYGYGVGHFGGGFFPYGFCKSQVPGKGKQGHTKRCFTSYLGLPGLSYGLGHGAGIPGYGLGFGLGYGYGYPGYAYPFGFYKSQIAKCKKHNKRCLPGLQYPYGLYPGFGCSGALCGGIGGLGLSGSPWGLGGGYYPGGFGDMFYRSKLPKGKTSESDKKVQRKHIIGYHPGIYTGLTGAFYPSLTPSSFSYGFPLGSGLPVYGGLHPGEFYRSEVPHDEEKEGKARDAIVQPSASRQVIGSALGGSLHGDGQGLGIGYPGAANLIQPGIAGVGDYGLGGGFSGIPLGLGNTGFSGYGMGGLGGLGLGGGFGGLGLGGGLSTAFGGDLAEGGFGVPHRSMVPEADLSDEGQEESNEGQGKMDEGKEDKDKSQDKGEEVSDEGEEKEVSDKGQNKGEEVSDKGQDKEQEQEVSDKSEEKGEESSDEGQDKGQEDSNEAEKVNEDNEKGQADENEGQGATKEDKHDKQESDEGQNEQSQDQNETEEKDQNQEGSNDKESNESEESEQNDKEEHASHSKRQAVPVPAPHVIAGTSAAPFQGMAGQFITLDQKLILEKEEKAAIKEHLEALQQENKQLKHEIQAHLETIGHLKTELNRLHDLSQRYLHDVFNNTQPG